MTGPLTPERKQGIRERIEKLKAGERSVRGLAADVPVHVVNTYRDDKGRRCTAFLAEFHSATEDNQANAELFAKSFTDLPDMYESHEALVEALRRAEMKLHAYVGVCKGDKELTDTVLPMARAALRNAGVTP